MKSTLLEPYFTAVIALYVTNVLGLQPTTSKLGDLCSTTAPALPQSSVYFFTKYLILVTFESYQD